MMADDYTKGAATIYKPNVTTYYFVTSANNLSVVTLCKCNLFTYVAFTQISIVATVTIAELLGPQ